MYQLSRHCFRSLLITLAVVLNGCLSLKQVGDFSAASKKSIENFETLPYSFAQNCMAVCLDRNIRDLKLDTASCNCSVAVQADHTDLVLYKAIDDYLDGLQRLSDGQLTVYSFNTLGDQLVGGGLIKHGLNQEQAGAYSKLAAILTHAVTEGYRKNKIKEYIRAANEPLKVLIRALQFNLSKNLLQALRNRQIELKSTYNKIIKDASNTPFEKRSAINEYYAQTMSLDGKMVVLQSYCKLLQVVADGHQKLYDSLDELKRDDIKAMISSYASNIMDIDAQIKILSRHE